MTTSGARKAFLVLLCLLCLPACARETAGTWSAMTGNYTAAETKLQGMLEKNPDDLMIRRRLATTYFHDQKYQASAEQFGYVVQHDGKLRPEEQIDYGLALIGAGDNAQGLNVLGNFSYPEHYRIQQAVQEEAGKLDTSKDPQLLGIQLDKAWDRGRQFEEEERRPSHGSHDF